MYWPAACLCSVSFIPTYNYFPILALSPFTSISLFLCPYLLPDKKPAPNYFLLIGSSFAPSVPKFANSYKVTYIISDIDGISDMVTWVLCNSKKFSSNYLWYLANFPLTVSEIQLFFTLMALFLHSKLFLWASHSVICYVQKFLISCSVTCFVLFHYITFRSWT